jgi:hypothetical protein
MTKRMGRAFLAAVAVGSLPLAAFADEIVHFTNGAEMTVRSHTVETAKDMVQLDLGGNSYISFPMSMVDKIVSAGKDVFLNPVFHPSNQAIAGGSGSAVADSGVRGTENAPYKRIPGSKGVGQNLGEAMDATPIAAPSGQLVDNQVINSRRAFNPAIPAKPGVTQVIMPPGAPKAPVAMVMIPSQGAPPAPPPPPAPANNDTQENAPAGDPAPEDPPDTP